MKNTKTLTPEESIKIAEATMEWCLKKFGNPLKTHTPSLKVSFDRRVKNNYGEYYNKVVKVYPNVCETSNRIIRTVIHEYCHFLQMPKLHNLSRYSKLYKKYGYDNHPFEIEARLYEKIYYSSCRSSLKRNGVI